MTPNEHTSQTLTDTINWHPAAKAQDFPENGGACVYIEGKQIAVFNFSARNEWYACPFHKKTFSLSTGKSLNGDTCDIDTYPIRVEEGVVYIGLS